MSGSFAVSPSVQSPRAYDLANLQSAQLWSRFTQTQVGSKLYPVLPEEGSLTIANGYYPPWDMRRYFSGAVTADSSAQFNAAIAQAAAQGVREIKAPGKWTITSPILIDNVFNQGMDIYIHELVAGTTGTWAAAPANWRSGTAMIKVGTASSGSMINLRVFVGSIRGNTRKADGIHIGNGSYGCGMCLFYVGDVQDLNVFVKGNSNSIWPTSSNHFSGRSVTNCNMGFDLAGATYPMEGTIIDYDFIWTNLYGGVRAGVGTQYLDVRSQLDFNGGLLTEFKVSSLSTFAETNTITGGTSGKTAEIIALYTYQGANYLLAIETAKGNGNASQFTNGETVTSGAASATLTTTRSVNQAGSAFYFDIVMNARSQSFHRAFIRAPYFGGIVGANLNSCWIEQGNANNGILAQIGGLGIASSPTTISVYDMLNDGASVLDITSTLFAPKRDLYLGSGNRRIYQNETAVAAVSGTPITIFSFGTPTNGAQYLFTCSVPGDTAMRDMGIVTVANTGVVAYKSLDAANITTSVSGSNIQVLHGTGGTKTIWGTLLQVR